MGGVVSMRCHAGRVGHCDRAGQGGGGGTPKTARLRPVSPPRRPHPRHWKPGRAQQGADAMNAENRQLADLPGLSRSAPADGQGAAGGHQTINRVTRILEEVVYRPGSTYAELTRVVGAPKSSVYGFIRGLLAADWLFEQDHRLYVGPAFYGLAIASGHIRAGLVTQAHLETLYREAGMAAFVGVRAGDHLIYIAEAGNDLTTGYGFRSDIRRGLLTTAGGKALLGELPETELEA